MPCVDLYFYCVVCESYCMWDGMVRVNKQVYLIVDFEQEVCMHMQFTGVPAIEHDFRAPFVVQGNGNVPGA